MIRLTFLYFLFLPLYVFSQNDYIFQHITMEDGLLADAKVRMAQDPLGFYWFANIYGMQRFDGKNFISYKYRNTDLTYQLPGDMIQQVTFDAEKNIWIINSEGINIFNRNKRTFDRLYMSDAADSNRSNVTLLITDQENNLWIVTDANLFKYSYPLHKPVLYAHLINEAHEAIQNVQYDKIRNGFWMLTSGNKRQLLYFDAAKKKLYYPANNNVDSLLGRVNDISFFKMDESGNIWMANYVGDLCMYNTASGKATRFDILHERNDLKIGTPNSTIFDCIEDGNGSVWFCGDYYLGLLQFDKKTNTFSRIEYNNSSEYALHYNEVVYSFYKDREDNIWINTDLGMNIFNPEARHFKYLQPKPESSVTRFSAEVSSIFQSRSGDIWVSTWGDGVFRYDSNFVFLKNYVHDKNDAASFGESLNRAWCFAEDDGGKIWIGCQYGLISILNPATGKFTNIAVPAFKGSTIMKMLKDKSGNFWFGLYNGYLATCHQNMQSIQVFSDVMTKSLQTFTSVDGICLDPQQNIWWSPGANGIKKFDVHQNSITDSALFPLHISSPSFLNDSEMIGGTDTKGFFILNIHTKKVRFINATNGLSTNNVFGAIANGSKEIWIAASNGMERLNMQTNKIAKFDINDGIRDHELTDAFYTLKNGVILFAVKTGIIYFNPAEIHAAPLPQDVCITKFIAQTHDYSVDSLLQKKEIILPQNQNAITIEYASLSFAGKSTDQYFYQLAGVNDSWVSAGAQRSVTYANLSPGSYVFKVKSLNRDGAESRNITQLHLVILAPWWQTYWAYVLWFLIAATILYVLYDYRKRNLAALSGVRQRIATDLHDDIGSTLNSISVYSEIAGKQMQSNPINAKNLLEKMGDSSRNMIDMMNDIVWAINPKNDQFENILQRMQYFAGELLSGKNILLQFDADEKIKRIKLSMVKRKNLYLIFKEAVNNAYKYSDAKTVSVSVALQATHLLMIITDDGIGFETAEKTMGGNGLKNMHNRAKETGSQLHIISWMKKGTRIELQMPV